MRTQGVGHNGVVLRKLDLDNTKVSGAGLRLVRTLPALESLSLSFNPLTDADLAELEGHAGIKTLLLYKTQVSDVGLGRLIHLPALEFVNVGESRVTEDGPSVLRLARPGISIVR